MIVESKFGKNPHLNPAAGNNPSQMSQEWIEKNIEDLAKYDENLATELRRAFKDKRIKGMVVNTKVDVNGKILDPEFELKELSEIGIGAW